MRLTFDAGQFSIRRDELARFAGSDLAAGGTSVSDRQTAASGSPD
jgi:hypothetical protein